MNENTELKNIPQELKWEGLWCCWKLTEKGKVPFNPLTGGFAKSNDPTTFCSYMQLLQVAHQYIKFDEGGKQKGGIGLGIFKGYSAVDIDHCIDDNGNISSMAQDIIDFCQSYTEYSPSGHGIRIIFKTNVLIDKNEYYIKNSNCGLEIYISDNTNKFVTITGNRINDILTDINTVDITYVLNKYMRRNAFDINKVLEKDDKLRELWNTIAPGSGSNESELDMALCCKLAYYLKNDEGEVERYFRMSPYYNSKDELHKNKWNRKDYSASTIRSAINYIDYNPVKPVQREIKNYELNDTGNSHRFADRFGDDVKYNVDNERWMLWNGSYWQYDVKETIRNYIEILGEEMLFESNSINDPNHRAKFLKNIDYIYNSSGKSNLLKESQHLSGIPVLNEELDKNPYLLCSDNGTINLKTGETSENKKSDLISQTCNGEISFEKPERFLRFLDEIFEGNQSLIDYMHRALGYSSTNTTREQCMFILYGDGNNGKSLLLEIIGKALGSYACTSRPQLLTEQPNGNSNLEEIARLKGKRFISVEEVRAGDKLNESLVKSLTSGIGKQSARFLYGNTFEFYVTGKIWMATNYEPTIRGTDKGIWRRIKKIPVNVDFTGREDKDLKDKLVNELPQIRGWLIDGAKKYFEEGLEDTKEISEATKQYREDNDLVQQWINEYCDLDKNYSEKSSILWDNFNAFTIKGNYGRFNQTLFGRNMGKKFKKKLINGKMIYFGIRLKLGEADLAKKVAWEKIEIDENV